MTELFANFSVSTLNGAINNSQTTLDVISAAAFPASGTFRIIVDNNEIMTVTGVSGTTFTVTRSSEAVGGVTSAVAHSNGAQVAHILTAGSIAAIGSGGGGSGLTQSYSGYNTIGGSTEAVTNNKIYWKKITLSNDCLVTSIGAYVQQVNTNSTVEMNIGIATDSGGVPTTLIAVNNGSSDPNGFLTGAAGTVSWLEMPIGIWLTAGDYWVCVQFFRNPATFDVYYDSGTDRTATAGGFYVAPDAIHTTSDSTRKYSIRANTIR